MLAMNGVEKSRVLHSLPEYSRRDSRRVVFGMDREKYGRPSEEAEVLSPPLEVAAEKWKVRGCKIHAHSQILRIRAEESHLVEEIIREGNFVVFSRPILPASPLSGNTAKC